MLLDPTYLSFFIYKIIKIGDQMVPQKLNILGGDHWGKAHGYPLGSVPQNLLHIESLLCLHVPEMISQEEKQLVLGGKHHILGHINRGVLELYEISQKTCVPHRKPYGKCWALQQ